MKLRLFSFFVWGLLFVISARNSKTQDTGSLDISSIQFSSDTKCIFIAEYSGRILRWNLIRDTIDKIYISDKNGLDLFVLDDGLHLLTAGLDDIPGGNYSNSSMSVTIEKWNIITGEKKSIKKFTDSELFLPKLSPSGKFLVYALNKTLIKVIKLDDNSYYSINLKDIVKNISPNKIRDKKDFSEDLDIKDYQSYRQNNEDFFGIINICFSNNGKYCEVMNLFGDLFIIDLDNREVEMLIKDLSPYQFRMPAISDKLGVATFISGSVFEQDYYLYFIDIKKNQILDSVSLNKLKHEISAFVFSKNDDCLLFGTEFDRFGKYDFKNELIYLEKQRKEGQSFKINKDPISEIVKLILSHDEYLLAGITLLGDIVIWDVNKLQHIKDSHSIVIPEHKKY